MAPPPLGSVDLGKEYLVSLFQATGSCGIAQRMFLDLLAIPGHWSSWEEGEGYAAAEGHSVG